MSNLEVLIATMNQSDFSLVKKMNIHSDAVFANQADRNELCVLEQDGYHFCMQTTDTRGVGLNRNIALCRARKEILLLADDDITYSDDYVEQVLKAFDEIPDADVIIFRMQFTKNNVVYETNCFNTHRLHQWSRLGFGTYQIAIRRKSILRTNIHFTHLFGGGAIYGSGEDSLFLLDCLRSGLHVYTHKYLLGSNRKDESSWFEGYTEKFFYDKGAYLSLAQPILKYVYLCRFIFGIKNKCSLSTRTKYCAMRSGMRGYGSLRTYNQWVNSNRSR